MEREHEAQAFGQGLSSLHLENLPLVQAMIEIALRVTGTYGEAELTHARCRCGATLCVFQICQAFSMASRSCI